MADEDTSNLLKGFWTEQASKGPKVQAPPPSPNLGEHTVATVDSSLQIDETTKTLPRTAPRLPGERVLPDVSGPVVQDFGARVAKASTEEMGITLDDLLEALLAAGSSDLHLSSGLKPTMRKNGDLIPMDQFSILSSMNIRTLLYSIMSEEQQAQFEKTKELDMAHSIPGKSRFRVNVMHQRHNVDSVIRVIPNEIKSLEELNMPDSLNDLANLPRGLVLVTGPTGSGKSTTLAAIVDRANRTRKDNIITIEDPIEFVHENKNCVVRQREVGVDTDSFAEALRRALRQDPDIILLGEMRDYETISTAITAAETGHLVFGTLHTQSAAETMTRIIDSFPDGSKNQVRAQLAATIQGIVCQSLIKTLDGKGRVAAVEILRGEPSIRSLIRSGKPEQIQSALETNKQNGMQTLDMHLKELVLTNVVAVDEAINRASVPKAFISSLGGEEALNGIRRRQRDAVNPLTQSRGVSMIGSR